jgi:hypothetical protein
MNFIIALHISLAWSTVSNGILDNFVMMFKVKFGQFDVVDFIKAGIRLSNEAF